MISQVNANYFFFFKFLVPMSILKKANMTTLVYTFKFFKKVMKFSTDAKNIVAFLVEKKCIYLTYQFFHACKYCLLTIKFKLQSKR